MSVVPPHWLHSPGLKEYFYDSASQGQKFGLIAFAVVVGVLFPMIASIGLGTLLGVCVLGIFYELFSRTRSVGHVLEILCISGLVTMILGPLVANVLRISVEISMLGVYLVMVSLFSMRMMGQLFLNPITPGVAFLQYIGFVYWVFFGGLLEWQSLIIWKGFVVVLLLVGVQSLLEVFSRSTWMAEGEKVTMSTWNLVVQLMMYSVLVFFAFSYADALTRHQLFIAHFFLGMGAVYIIPSVIGVFSRKGDHPHKYRVYDLKASRKLALVAVVLFSVSFWFNENYIFLPAVEAIYLVTFVFTLLTTGLGRLHSFLAKE